MNKKELISAMAESAGTTQVEAGNILSAFCDVVVSELKDGNSVTIPGFGQFIPKHRPSRQVRNPQTKEMMMSKEKTVTQFKPSSALKDL